MCTTVQSIQAGLDRISAIMSKKQLQLNIDKSCYILLGNNTAVNKIRNLIKENPLFLKGEKIKEEQFEKYLGDQIHSDGLKQSTATTIDKRYWIAMSAVLEISAILDDFRVHIPGGINSALNLWELAVIPMLLNNADTWDIISDDTVKKMTSSSIP